MRHLVGIIAELTIAIAAETRTQNIIERIEGFIGRHRKLSVQLQMIIVRIVGVANTVMVIAQLAPHTIVSSQVLSICTSLNRNTVGQVYVSGANYMPAVIERHVVIETLNRRAAFDILQQPARQTAVPTYVSGLTGKTQLVRTNGVALPKDRSAVIVNRHRMEEHVRRIERIACRDATVHTETIQVILVPTIRVAVDREEKSIRRRPLPRCLREIIGDVAVVIQEMLQFIPLIPLSKPLTRHGIATEIGCREERKRQTGNHHHCERTSHVVGFFLRIGIL